MGTRMDNTTSRNQGHGQEDSEGPGSLWCPNGCSIHKTGVACRGTHLCSFRTLPAFPTGWSLHKEVSAWGPAEDPHIPKIPQQHAGHFLYHSISSKSFLWTFQPRCACQPLIASQGSRMRRWIQGPWAKIRGSETSVRAVASVARAGADDLSFEGEWHEHHEPLGHLKPLKLMFGSYLLTGFDSWTCLAIQSGQGFELPQGHDELPAQWTNGACGGVGQEFGQHHQS